MPNTIQCILKGSKMHVFVTFFPINHYQLGVAHSNEVSEEAQSSQEARGVKNFWWAKVTVPTNWLHNFKV